MAAGGRCDNVTVSRPVFLKSPYIRAGSKTLTELASIFVTLSQIRADAAQREHAEAAIVARFIGLTPLSSAGMTLLAGLTRQIAELYDAQEVLSSRPRIGLLRLIPLIGMLPGVGLASNRRGNSSVTLRRAAPPANPLGVLGQDSARSS
jgi:hypothetical protein